jgi:hypothetical protein
MSRKKTSGAIGLVIAIATHPAVQEAGIKIAKAGLGKAQRWWADLALRKAAKHASSARKKKSSSARKSSPKKSEPRRTRKKR